MKIFLAPLVIATIISMTANAQDSSAVATDTASSTQQQINAPNPRVMQKRSEMNDRYRRLPPERRPGMDRHHEMMEKLSSQQKEEVKKEFERHRTEMKRITGFEPEMPPMHQ